MRRGVFDYSFTCPKIDENIDNFRQLLDDKVYSFMEKYLPNLEDSKDIRDELLDDIYDSAEEIFENVRECNDDMRKEAEWQIEEKNDEIEELKHQVSHLEWEKEELEDKVNDLKDDK